VELQVSKLIRRLPDLAIDYLPMPRVSTDPLALFASAHLNALLRQLREQYDCILIDSPPVLGVTETRLLRAVADKIIFVAKWGSTNREVARNALEGLCSVRETAAGRTVETVAVVTQVDFKQHATYHYGDAVETYVKYQKYFNGSSAA
jgi:Mrp family chromosome partitioning ATPase